MAIYPLEGGYICSRCPSPRSAPVVIEPEHVQLIVLLGSNGPVEAAEIPLSPRQHRALRALMRATFHGIFEKPIRSEPFALDPRWGFLDPGVGMTPAKAPSEATK